jgi:hypothetical protein
MALETFPPASRQRLLQSLHLFYAGYLALLLPFICWGTQATPGHPHAIPHFVFAEPTRSTVMTTTGLDAAAFLATLGEDDLCSSTESLSLQQRASETAQLPAGSSIPSLVVSLLLLAAAAVTPLLSARLRQSAVRYWGDSLTGGLLPAVPTPPPR